MKTFNVVVLFSAFVCLPVYAAREAAIHFTNGKALTVSSFSWGTGESCVTNEMHFTVAGNGPGPFSQACQTNEQIPEFTLDFFNAHHVIQGGRASCQNNLVTIRFTRCSVHAKVAPVAASLLPPNMKPPQPNSALVIDGDLPENFDLVGFQAVGPTTIVLKTKGASPKLFMKCAKGSHFKEAIVTCRKAGGTQQEYYKVKLTEVFVSGYQTNADGSQSLTLNFTRHDGSFAGFQDLH